MKYAPIEIMIKGTTVTATLNMSLVTGMMMIVATISTTIVTNAIKTNWFISFPKGCIADLLYSICVDLHNFQHLVNVRNYCRISLAIP